MKQLTNKLALLMGILRACRMRKMRAYYKQTCSVFVLVLISNVVARNHPTFFYHKSKEDDASRNGGWIHRTRNPSRHS